MSLQKQVNQILCLLYSDFEQTGLSPNCLTRTKPFAKDSIHITDDLDTVTFLSSEYVGVDKDKILHDLATKDDKSFENTLSYMELSEGYIEYSDNDLFEPEPGHINNPECAIGYGPRKFVRLTLEGYLQAGKITSDPELIPGNDKMPMPDTITYSKKKLIIYGDNCTFPLGRDRNRIIEKLWGRPGTLELVEFNRKVVKGYPLEILSMDVRCRQEQIKSKCDSLSRSLRAKNIPITISILEGKARLLYRK